MKKIVLPLILLIAICLPLNSIAREYFSDTIMNETLSGTKVSKQVNLAGYKDFTVLVSITGAHSPTATTGMAIQTIRLDINNNPASGGGFVIARETITLSAQGQAVFKNICRIYAPYISVAVVSPPPNTQAQIFVYAGH